MKFISHLLRSSSSQNLTYSCALDFEINRRGDHRSPVLQTRNFNRGPRKAKAFWGKGERNEVFIMNFKKFIQTRNFFRRVTGSSHIHFYIKIKKTSVWMSFLFGGNNRARTCDPLLVRQMLSQLSYAPTHIRRTCDVLYNTISQLKSQYFFETFLNFFIWLFAPAIFQFQTV